MRISVRFGQFFIKLSCSGHKLQRLCQGKAQRLQRAKNRTEPFPGTIGRAISNLVAVLVSDLWAMAGKMAKVFTIIGRHLECAIQTELIVELELALIERKQYR